MTAPDVATGGRDVAFGWRLVDAAVAVGRRVQVKHARSGYPYLLTVPAILLMCLLAGGVLYLFWLSIHQFDAFTREQGPLSLENLRRLFTGANAAYYTNALFRTVLVSLFVTTGAVAVAVPLAYFVVRLQRRGWRTFVLVFLLVPFLMGETVRAFGWLLLLGKDGAVAWTLDLVNLRPQLLGTLTSIWIGMMQVMVPIATLVLMPAVRRINPDLERAAMTLGARPRKVWFRIVVPLAWQGIIGAAITVFTLSMTEFAIPEILGLGQLPLVANAVRNLFFINNNVYLGSAYSMVLIVVVMVIVFAIVFFGRIVGDHRAPRWERRLVRAKAESGKP